MGSVAQLAASQVHLVVAVHANPREDLQASVDVAAAQQVVDALGPQGVRALGVAGAVGEEIQELGVRQDAAVPVACNLY